MGRNLNMTLAIFFVFSLSVTLFCQTADSTVTPPAPVSSGSTDSDIVDLSQEAVIIKVEPERPRVNIFAERIKPEFDDINLDKSFMNELTGKGEKVIILDEKRVSEQFQVIDVEKILNRTR
jgi:hypothetical protein